MKISLLFFLLCLAGSSCRKQEPTASDFVGCYAGHFAHTAQADHLTITQAGMELLNIYPVAACGNPGQWLIYNYTQDRLLFLNGVDSVMENGCRQAVSQLYQVELTVAKGSVYLMVTHGTEVIEFSGLRE